MQICPCTEEVRTTTAWPGGVGKLHSSTTRFCHRGVLLKEYQHVRTQPAIYFTMLAEPVGLAQPRPPALPTDYLARVQPQSASVYGTEGTPSNRTRPIPTRELSGVATGANVITRRSSPSMNTFPRNVLRVRTSFELRGGLLPLLFPSKDGFHMDIVNRKIDQTVYIK